MSYNLYRVIRKDKYEEWILSRKENNYVERILIVFENDMTEIYVITLDKNFIKKTKTINIIYNLFHFDKNYSGEKLELILVKPFNGVIVDEENNIDIINSEMNKLKQKKGLI